MKNINNKTKIKMENLTENQTKIINSIINEFDRINDVKKNNNNNLLFNTDLLFDKIKKEEKLTAEIRLNNEHIESLNIQRIQEDADRLNESLNGVGIEATINGCHVLIQRKDKKGRDNNLRITYVTDSYHVSINNFTSIQKRTTIKKLACYLTSSYNETFFNNIDELCNHSAFVNVIQKLM
jgi:hypothetical protein